MTAEQDHDTDWGFYATQGKDFAQKLYPQQVRYAINYVRENRHQPFVLKKQLGNIFYLLAQVQAQPDLTLIVLDLIQMLDTLPYRLGYWTEWEDALRYAIRSTHDHPHPAMQIEFLQQLANLMLLKGQWVEAQDLSQSAWVIARGMGDSALIMQAASGMIGALLDGGKLHEANALLEAATHEAQQTDAERPLPAVVAGRLAYLRALLGWYRGELHSAVNDFDQAITQLQASAALEAAHAYRLRGLSFWQLGDYLPAVRDFKQAARHFEKQADLYSMWWALGNLGLVYWSIGRLDRAQHLTRRSLRVFRRFGSSWQVAGQLGNLCVIYLSAGRLPQALRVAEEHVQLAQRLNLPVQIMRAEANYAIIQLHQG